MYDVRLLIDDQDLAASTAATFQRRNPVTGEVASVAAAATVADADRAANSAAAAFPAWSSTSPTQRRAMLNKAANILDRRAGEFADAAMMETGATRMWILFNCKLAANVLREAASMTTQVGGEVIPSDHEGAISLSVRQPAGVCVGIAPWNAPVILGVRAIAMPLACGNTVILKASELCPKTHQLIGDVLREAGLPKGVVNVLSNAPEDAGAVVEALIAHPAVRRVNFTGSTRVGRLIAETCARHLKRCLLELGGKAPLIVLDDADLDEAVKAAAFGAFMNQGQICMSTERLIVLDSVADEFARRFKAKVATLKAGDPRQGNTALGAVVNAGAVERISQLVTDAVEKGASVLTGGDSDGAIMAPTVLDHVTRSMNIFHEESFGPCVSIVRVADLDEAVTVANDTEYGLSAAVFSQNIARAMEVARRIESGICHINGPTVADEPQVPFGGVKSSGYGRFGGKAAIDEFTDLRWITLQTAPGHYPI
ncbi:aldehyde dehydrogenase [Pseudomonas sp. NPDC090208]|uniref:aldehyde dehydrogenase n=1 Tax=Pseudomonas sp. NPDC090208 TaxID=3364478 RepID=UPI0037F6DE86